MSKLKAAILPLDGKPHLIVERGDKIVPAPSHWMGWADCYGPFASSSDAILQVKDYFPHVGVLNVQRLTSPEKDGNRWPPAVIERRLLREVQDPYPRVTKRRQPAKVDLIAMEVECECGSTDLQLESLDIVATEYPDGPWLVECNECGCETDVYDAMMEAWNGTAE